MERTISFIINFLCKQEKKIQLLEKSKKLERKLHFEQLFLKSMPPNNAHYKVDHLHKTINLTSIHATIAREKVIGLATVLVDVTF